MLGKVFNCWTVISASDRRTKSREKYWACRCSCGTVKEVRGSSLRRGESKSCGCLKRELASDRAKTHGQTGTLTYSSWSHMLTRCHNPNDPEYWRYGGSGIGVCEEWLDFNNFWRDMGDRPSKGYTLDRIDSSTGYFKSNCRWESKGTQSRNKKNTLSEKIVREIKLMYKEGMRKKEISERLDVSYNRVVDITLGRSWKEF